MKKLLHVNLLLLVAVALFVLEGTQVKCGVIIVQSSLASGWETLCNGLRCPPGSNCMVFTNIINGDRNSDTRCTNSYGKVVRQETVKVTNGQMCIKNLTTVENKVNVEHSCRKLTVDEMEQYEKERKIQEAVQVALEREQDALEREEERMERWREKLERETEQKIEAIDRANDQRGILEDLRKNLYELAAEAKHLAWERQSDALEEKLEREAELLEMQQEAKLAEIERAAEARQDRIDRKLNKLKVIAKARGARWGF